MNACVHSKNHFKKIKISYTSYTSMHSSYYICVSSRVHIWKYQLCDRALKICVWTLVCVGDNNQIFTEMRCIGSSSFPLFFLTIFLISLPTFRVEKLHLEYIYIFTDCRDKSLHKRIKQKPNTHVYTISSWTSFKVHVYIIWSGAEYTEGRILCIKNSQLRDLILNVSMIWILLLALLHKCLNRKLNVVSYSPLFDEERQRSI